jgi:hypothetical protein
MLREAVMIVPSRREVTKAVVSAYSNHGDDATPVV